MNLTLLSLSVSLLSHSPMIQLSSSSNYVLKSLNFNNFFSSFLCTYSNNIHASILDSKFNKFLRPPIYLHKEQFNNDEFNTTQEFNESSYVIDSCIFTNCLNDDKYDHGGAIHMIVPNSILTVHGTIF